MQDNYEVNWRVFTSVALGVLMATLDGSIVSVALPYIRDDFGVSLTEVKWVVSIYLLVITGLLLVFGRLADMFGQRPVYLWGMGLFTVGSAVCGLADTNANLIIARAAQGVGAGMIMACAPAITTAAFPPAQRGKGLGLIGTVVGLGLTAGPPLGGLLMTAFGWRSIFLINIPLGLFSIFFSIKQLPAMKFHNEKESFDFFGSVLMFLGLVFLLLGVDELEGGLNALSGGLLGGSVATLALFVAWEGRARHPLLDLKIFANKSFSAALVASVTSFASGFGVMLLLPFFMTDILKFSPAELGMWLMIMPLLVMLASPFSGALSDRIGYRALTTGGQAIRALSIVMFIFATREMSQAYLFGSLVLMGVGNGLFMSPNSASIMGLIERKYLGVAGGLTAVARNLGMSVGAGITTVVFALSLAQTQDYVEAWRSSMKVALFTCVVSLLFSAVRGSDPA